MRILNRYVIRQASVATVYALVALLSLYLFFDIMSEISDVGEGGYTATKMTQYVLMLLPAHAYELMPLAVLVGGLIALSQMAANSELTVIKTSGISLASIMTMLLQFGAIFALLTVLLGEWIVPTVGQQAERFKLNATENSISAGGNSGIWIKQDNDIINVAEMLPDGSLHGITIYRHNPAFQLTSTLHAASAKVDPHVTADAPAVWHLHNVVATELHAQNTTVHQKAQQDWPVAINQQLLNVLLVEPEQMSVWALHTYVQHLKENHQQTTRYELAWWRKLAYPLACLVMALVALAFTPQQSRHGNMGLKLFFGICLGLAFHFAGRLFGFTSQLYGVPTWLSAFLPTLLFLLLAIYLIRRQEKR
ncbi:LPS export ABC transporter permease LptG [Snodgrassella sp. CFCC 13594]|uniref:LPS export ABC transporter permease LptG n=1 Tax=Snodgrassella sp. CFCC 13594 TaxID=1775559 RepID=UPI0008303525|nr:LPS export ABC transporter permease LptG [Snodgrassella sp. CFCC 13594]